MATNTGNVAGTRCAIAAQSGNLAPHIRKLGSAGGPGLVGEPGAGPEAPVTVEEVRAQDGAFLRPDPARSLVDRHFRLNALPGAELGKIHVDVSPNDVVHRHGNRLAAGVAVLVGDARDGLVDVVLVLVRGLLEVLRGQGELPGAAVDGELRRVVALDRPQDVSLGEALERGRARRPGHVLVDRCVRQPGDGQAGVVVADHDDARTTHKRLGVVSARDDDPEALVLLPHGVLDRGDADGRGRRAGGNPDLAGRHGGEVVDWRGRARDRLPSDRDGLFDRQFHAHPDRRPVPLVDHRVLHMHPVAVLVANGGRGGTQDRVEAEAVGQAAQHHREGLVLLELFVVDRVHGKGRGRLVRGSRPRQRNGLAPLRLVVVARGRGAVAGRDVDVLAAGGDHGRVVHIDLELRLLAFVGRVCGLDAEHPEIAIHDREHLGEEMRVGPRPAEIRGIVRHQERLVALVQCVADGMHLEGGLELPLLEFDEPDVVRFGPHGAQASFEVASCHMHVLSSCGDAGPRVDDRVSRARARRLQADPYCARSRIGPVAPHPYGNALSFPDQPHLVGDRVADAAAVQDRPDGGPPRDRRARRVGQQHPEGLGVLDAVEVGPIRHVVVDRDVHGLHRLPRPERQGPGRDCLVVALDQAGARDGVGRAPTGRNGSVAVLRLDGDGHVRRLGVGQGDAEARRGAAPFVHRLRVADRQRRAVVVDDGAGGVQQRDGVLRLRGALPAGERGIRLEARHRLAVVEPQLEGLVRLVEVVVDRDELDARLLASGPDRDLPGLPSAVVLAEGRAVHGRRSGGPAQPDGLPGDLVQHGLEGQLPALGRRHVPHRDARAGVVVADDANGALPFGGIVEVPVHACRKRRREDHREVLVRLVERIVERPDPHDSAGPAGGNGERAGSGGVVLSRRRSLARCRLGLPGHLDVGRRGGAERDMKLQRLSLGPFRGVKDGQGRTVVNRDRRAD